MTLTQEEKVRNVTCWTTTDGRLFQSCTSAEHHQKALDDVACANKILEAGGSIASAETTRRS